MTEIVSLRPLLAVGAGLAVVLPILLSGRRPALREAWTFVAGAVQLGAALSMLPAAFAGAAHTSPALPLLPGMPLQFRADPLGLLFLTLSSILWLATSSYSVGYLRSLGLKHQTGYFAAFAAAVAAAAGVALAVNLLTFLICYEVLTLATWAAGGPQADLRRARLRTFLSRLHTDRRSTAAGRRRLGGNAGPRSAVHAGRLSRRRRLRRRPARPLRTAPGRGRLEGGGVPAARLVARGHGGAHPGERPAPCGRRGQGRGLRSAAADRLGLRSRPDARPGTQRAARRARRGDHPDGLAARARRGPLQAPARLLDHQPAQLHRSRRRDRHSARARGGGIPHRRPRVPEDHPVLLRRFGLCRHRQGTHLATVRARPGDAVHLRRLRRRRPRHGGRSPAPGIHQQVEPGPRARSTTTRSGWWRSSCSAGC